MSSQDKAIAKFVLEDGTEVYFEVPEPSSGDAVQEVALGQDVYEIAEGKFEQAIEKVRPVANAIVSRLKDGLTTPADEVEIKFGFNLTADAGVVFSSVSSGVSFAVTLKWKK